jgi:hypothetical protein
MKFEVHGGLAICILLNLINQLIFNIGLHDRFLSLIKYESFI